MSRLGRDYGLWLIKQALRVDGTPETREPVRWRHTPMPEGEETKRIHSIIDQNKFRDPMTDDWTSRPATRDAKIAATVAAYTPDFSSDSQIQEDDDKRLPQAKPVILTDSMDPDFDQAWDEHDAFKPSSHAIIEGATPGPAP